MATKWKKLIDVKSKYNVRCSIYKYKPKIKIKSVFIHQSQSTKRKKDPSYETLIRRMYVYGPVKKPFLLRCR